MVDSSLATCRTELCVEDGKGPGFQESGQQVVGVISQLDLLLGGSSRNVTIKTHLSIHFRAVWIFICVLHSDE